MPVGIFGAAPADSGLARIGQIELLNLGSEVSTGWMGSVDVPYRVRSAKAVDAAAIARIYNQGIEDRIATFETEPRTTGDIERLLAEREGRYPTIVVELGGDVVAWASAGSYRSRPCYDPIAEHSVYVDRASRGAGVGRLALEGLVAEAERLGLLKLVSRIFPENVASLALHRSVGFREVGVYRRHGQLDGAWRDCVIVERLLGDATIE